MRIGRHAIWRSGLRSLVLAGAIVALISVVGGCGTPAERSATPGGRVSASGFPLGSFAKEFEDPDLGRVRLVWTFREDGRWAEIPLALDGQTLPVPTVRGRYVVEGPSVTIATEYPPAWGTSRHEWRLEGDALWTTFASSDIADDAQWFAMLDARPWRPHLP